MALQELLFGMYKDKNYSGVKSLQIQFEQIPQSSPDYDYALYLAFVIEYNNSLDNVASESYLHSIVEQRPGVNLWGENGVLYQQARSHLSNRNGKLEMHAWQGALCTSIYGILNDVT